MKSNSCYIITLFILLAVLSVPSTAREKTVKNTNSYFPANNNIALVYTSSFGESITRYFQDGEFTISSSLGDKFRYKQTLKIKDNGVYIYGTYEFLKIFLFIKKEAAFTYEKPLLMFPLPLVPGMDWKWEGDEYSNGDTNRVKVSGKVLNEESIVTKAGKFETIKVESIVESSAGTKNIVTEWYAKGIGLIKAKIIIQGGGMMGFLRDILGYGTITFELKEIRKQ